MPSELSADRFQQAVEAAPGSVVVCFRAPWCPACQRLAPVLEEVEGQLAGQVAFYSVDTDHTPELAERFALQAIPVLLRFEAGKQVGQLLGYRSEETVRGFALGR